MLVMFYRFEEQVIEELFNVEAIDMSDGDVDSALGSDSEYDHEFSDEELLWIIYKK